MSLVFRENAKNCQNHGLIEGAVMGRHVYSARWNWSRLLCKLPEICNTQKIICLSFIDCSQFKFFRELRWKKILTVPLWGPPHWPPVYKISTPELMLCKKTSAITYQKIGPVTPGSDPPPGVCSSWSRVYHRDPVDVLGLTIGLPSKARFLSI